MFPDILEEPSINLMEFQPIFSLPFGEEPDMDGDEILHDRSNWNGGTFNDYDAAEAAGHEHARIHNLDFIGVI